MAIKFLSNETIDGTLVITGDLAINTNKFTVNATSGNTLVAGTLGVTSTLTSADITTGNISAGNVTLSGGITQNATNVTNTFKSGVLIAQPSNTGQQSILSIGSNAINDVVIGFQTDGNSMSMGIDRSDSNAFKISDSNGGLGTNDRFKIDTTGASFFTGLVSGITPTAAANFVTKEYIDGGGGAGSGFLPLTGGTLTGTLTGTTANFTGNVGIGVTADASVRNFIKGSDDSTNNYQILTRNSSDANILAVRNDGNVGIGTTPITSPNGADTSLSIFSGQDCGIILKDNVETWEIYQNDDLQFSFGTTPTTVMTMQRTTGNVGIGVTGPGSKLSIGGTTGSYTSGIGFQPIGTGARIYRTFIATDGSFRFDDVTAGSVTRLTIGSNGNIAQANSSPIADPFTGAGGEQWMTYQIGKAGVLGAYKNNNESMFGFNTYFSAPAGVNKAIVSGLGGTATRYYADRITFNTLTSSGTTQTNTERLQINSTGIVAIGIVANSTFPIYKGKVSAPFAGGWQALTPETTIGGIQQSNVRTDGGATSFSAGMEFYLENNTYGTGQTGIRFKCGGVNGADSTEKMRIASSGITTIGMTNTIGSAEVRIGGVGNATGNGTGKLNFVNSNSYKSWQISAGGTPTGALAFTQSGTFGADNFTVERMRITAAGEMQLKSDSDGNKFIITSSAGGNNAIIEMGQTGSDGFLDVSAAGGGVVTHLSGYTGYVSYFLSNVVVGGTAVDQAGTVSFKTNGIVRQVLSTGTVGDTLFNAISGVSNGLQIRNDASNNQEYLFHNISQITLAVKQSGVTLGSTNNSTTLNTQKTLLAGYGAIDPATSNLYGSYGFLGFNANNNYTGGARSMVFTNAYLANQFALIMSPSNQTLPALGTGGELSNGDLVFHVNNAKDFMFGKKSGDANGPHLKINSYAYSTVLQGSSTGNILDIRSGTQQNANVGMIRFLDNGGVQCGQIISNSATTTTQYLSGSDYRLKEDLKDFTGLDKVSKIKVYDFKWKKADERSYGVMAHELQEVLPQAVNGDKDAEEMQGVDYSKIVPLLVKSIQELKAEIEILKKK